MIQQVGSAEYIADQPLCTPGGTLNQAFEPPVYPGRFFDGKTSWKLNDDLTGIPWAFAPSPQLPRDHKRGELDGVLIADWHHAAHPRTKLEDGTDAEKAVRHASIQWTLRKEHDAYHLAKLQPLLPKTERESFIYVAARAARYITPRAIEFVEEGGRLLPKNRYMNIKERNRIWGENQIKVESHSKVRSFLTSYVLEKSLQEPSTETRELRDKYLEKPELLSIVLLRSLVNIALTESGFDKIYTQARKKNLIPADSYVKPENLMISRLLPASFGYNLSRANELVLQRLEGAEMRTLERLHIAAVASAEDRGEAA
jgi:hypothetical protein